MRERAEEHRLRSLRAVTPEQGSSTVVSIDGVRLVNFASNDYLGLTQHPLIKERVIQYTQKYGAGSGASRLLSGNLDCYESIENTLARLKGSEAALIFNSGYQANATLLACLAHANSTIFLDRLCHNSLLAGAMASNAKWARFKHNDLADLQSKLSKLRDSTLKTDGQEAKSDACELGAEAWVVTESVFSMDGDRTDITELVSAAAGAHTRLFIDEAHATGLMGQHGMGLAAGVDGLDIVMGTFGKALGSFGAYVACSFAMKEYLVNFCAGLIYSTALPPATLGAIEAALELIPKLDRERQTLADRAQAVRDELGLLGFDTGGSSTQIIPVIVGSDTQAVAAAQFLQERGILAPAIRPPTVPDRSARIRLSVTLAHTEEQIDKLVSAFKQWRRR
jgi:8-amino-7-oxononanoate synthase